MFSNDHHCFLYLIKRRPERYLQTNGRRFGEEEIHVIFFLEVVVGFNCNNIVSPFLPPESMAMTLFWRMSHEGRI